MNRQYHRKKCYVCQQDRKSTRLNSSHSQISYAVFCLKKKKLLLLALDRLAESRHGAARRLDLLDGPLRARVRSDGKLIGEVALAEHLHVDGGIWHETRGLERLRRELGARVEALIEAANVDGLGVRAERPDRHRVLGRVAAELAHPFFF